MTYDVVVVGAGPNGLTAAAMAARSGRRVLVVEAADDVGGGTRTEELTLDGFRSDVCSAVHPLAFASPAFAELDLTAHGLEWIHPDVPLAHPLDGGRAVLLHDSVDATADGLGRDGEAWRRLFSPHVDAWDELRTQVLGPVRVPRHPAALLRFGREGLLPAERLMRSRFTGDEAPARRRDRTRVPAPQSGVLGGLRVAPPHRRAGRRLAHRTWRVAGHRRRARPGHRVPRRHRRHRSACPIAAPAPSMRAGVPRHESGGRPADRGGSARPVGSAPGSVPSGTAPASSSSTTPSMRRSRGRTRRSDVRGRARRRGRA